ncbi:MAG: hypothetical protein ACI3ZQ_06200 [Candidatus Cryptobacteroides sp.]
MAISSYIKDLLDGKTIASSRLSKTDLDKYINEGLLSVIVRGTRKSVKARSVDILRQYLIDNDESCRILEADDASSRSSLAVATGNSKLMSVRSCPGFPVNLYEPLECRLDGNPLLISPVKGMFVFVCNWTSFSIPEDVTVVGIENMENFRMVHLQKSLFEKCLGTDRLLFVSRYPQSTDLRNWLLSIPNKYVHFGDFDLAGINIYQVEFKKYLGDRASLLIPPDIETRIIKGSSKRYDDQFMRFGKLTSDEPDVRNLIDLLNRERKAYDQEGYI